eukprot:2729564-Amphidinium_carterae.1
MSAVTAHARVVRNGFIILSHDGKDVDVVHPGTSATLAMTTIFRGMPASSSMELSVLLIVIATWQLHCNNVCMRSVSLRNTDGCASLRRTLGAGCDRRK